MRFEPYGAADYDVLNGPNLGFEYAEGVMSEVQKLVGLFYPEHLTSAIQALARRHVHHTATKLAGTHHP